MTHVLPQEIADALEAEERLGASEAATGGDLEGIVTDMLAARENVDALEATLKNARTAYDDLRKRVLPGKMQELGLVGPDGRGGFTHSSGVRVHLRVEVWASIKAEARDETYAWLRDNGHGGIIKETVNAQTLRAFAKERLEDGEPLPPGVSTTVETIAVIVKPKGA